jgi:hypothetical protein
VTNTHSSETFQEALRAAMIRDAEIVRARRERENLAAIPECEFDYTPHQQGEASEIDEHIFNTGRSR